MLRWICSKLGTFIRITKAKVACTRFTVQTSVVTFPANIYLFKVNNGNTGKEMWNMSKVNNKNTRTTSLTSKVKESKEEKRISVENLTGYDDIVCKFARCTFVDDVTIYLIKLWISPAGSCEFNVVCAQQEKSQYLLCYNNKTYNFKNKNYRKSLRDIFLYHFLF